MIDFIIGLLLLLVLLAPLSSFSIVELCYSIYCTVLPIVNIR